ncbi:MAG: carboxypeptidase regulatory-like domain-containing protein, partial [Thermoplasmatales archaeon]|nr:carboxypeptidase regulatory-like domain-containing protein [Thermoplasmatales archaeon]
MKHNTEKFEIMSSDILASFAFSYHHGIEDNHEISSDQLLVSKEISVDGNLMVELGIISESSNKELRTTNIYKYYYCPTIDKRISVKVNHEVLEDVSVKGIVNVDGRYGALLSLKSKNIAIKKMNFGEILPYIHVYGENDRIKEYKMNKNPDDKEREWIISYSDDCDIGRDAWISYDEGDSGKCHAILFSSNKGIVKQGTSERDGIEVKAAVREYLDIVGTEVDYASITFGRNSYEKDKNHDVNIPGDLRVEFEVEFFTVEDGNYEDVAEEGKLFRTLVKHRYEHEDDLFEGDQNIHTLTIIPHMSGRIISYPYLVNLTGFALPVTWVELYQNDTLISSGIVNKPFIGFQTIKFPKLAPGEYVIKIYRKIGNDTKNYIGVGSVRIEEDIVLHIYCAWQKSIKLTVHDQYDSHIKDIELVLLKDNIVVLRNITGDAKETTLNVPFNLFDSYALLKGKQIKGKMLSFPFDLSDPYVLKAFYKGFIIYDDEIARLQKSADMGIDLYDLTVNIEDKLGLPPGVDARPFLTSSEMYRPLEIIPKNMGNGKYLFERLPAATYEFQISYGAFSDSKTIHVPKDGNHVNIRFTANFDLTTELLNSRGEHIQEVNHKIEIIRGGWKIHEPVSSGEIISLPPGKYTINVYSES